MSIPSSSRALHLADVLGNNAVQRIAHVRANVLVVVLVETEPAARVLQGQREQAYAVARELRQRAGDLGGYQV